jgi:DNA excision repair protein ERCC-3
MERDNTLMPLMVQSDRTMLLDVHSPSADECRRDIISFSSLVKSPEHIHTYELTPLSLWNAVSLGLGEKEIIERLRKWSRYDLDNRVLFFISDTVDRYGKLKLEEYDDGHYRLSVQNAILFVKLRSDSTVMKYLVPGGGDNSFLLEKIYRGKIKAELIKRGYPVTDTIPLTKGGPLDVSLKDDVVLRDYQKAARESFVASGGYGTVVLPCGSGKTVVGMAVMEALKTKTIILCPNVTAVHQWIRELKDKTNLTDNEIGEYTGQSKDIKDVTICTYQVLIYSETKTDEDGREIKEYPNFSLFRSKDWGLVIYDEVHMLPAPVFSITSEIQAMHRLGLTATLVREDGREDEVFTLVGPKRIDIPWVELEEKGFIAKAYCHEVKVPLRKDDELVYALATRQTKYKIAAVNDRKIEVTEQILKKHEGEQILIIGQYLEQLGYFRKKFGYPLITGSTPNKTRDELYDDFRNGRIKVLIVSKVANYAIDLPDATVAIQISGTFGSRQEEAQRLGRILRPHDRDSHFYTLVSEYTIEEEMNSNRQKFLSEQGYSYTIEHYGENT